MTYAREHRRAVKKIKAKQKNKEPLRKWEQKRLDHDKQMDAVAGKKGE